MQFAQKISLQDLKSSSRERAEAFAKATAPSEESDVDTSLKLHWQRLQPLAQAGLTYILCQNDQGLVLIDQHAAHERILFEKIMRAWLSGQVEVQNFLFPIPVSLSEEAVEAVFAYAGELRKIGMELEKLGPGEIGVSSCASFLKDEKIPEVLHAMADEILKYGGSLKIEKMMGDLAASMACHSAIRAGQALGLDEMRNLLKQMDESPVSSYCPHGRPVSVEYSFHQLEKDFGRIPG